MTNSSAIELYDFYLSVTEKRKPEEDVKEAYKDTVIPNRILRVGKTEEGS